MYIFIYIKINIKYEIKNLYATRAYHALKCTEQSPKKTAVKSCTVTKLRGSCSLSLHYGNRHLRISFLTSPSSPFPPLVFPPTPLSPPFLQESHPVISVLTFPCHHSAMKLINSINPKQLFSFTKPRSVTRSEPPSFSTTISSLSSSTDSSSSSHTAKGDHKTRRSATPRSVLPARTRSHEITREISGQWPDDASEDSFYELVEAFKMIDRNGDGKITKRQLEDLFGRIGKEPLSEEEIAAILREIDRDGDGCISLEEFGAISSAFGPASDMAELREAFDVFDVDHDGKITAEELLNVFVAIGDNRCTLEDCRGMIRSVDRNGDGFVCFEDFALMMDPQRC